MEKQRRGQWKAEIYTWKEVRFVGATSASFSVFFLVEYRIFFYICVRLLLCLHALSAYVWGRKDMGRSHA